jgi:hypothetical protein
MKCIALKLRDERLRLWRAEVNAGFGAIERDPDVLRAS